jgi:ribonuclease D
LAIHLHQNDLPDGLDLGPVVAIDTETMGLDPRRDRLCVVQLSDGRRRRASGADRPRPDPRAQSGTVLTDPAVLKLFHFGRFDIAALKQAFGVTTAPVWCTKIASKLVRTLPTGMG